jgi:transcriptional regulator with XRE-family HTH domain
MVRNQAKYEQAIAFRQRGFTQAEIAKICDVSKSTVSNWLKNKPFSAQISQQNLRRARHENGKRLKLVQKARNLERTQRYLEATRSAKTEYTHYVKQPLFMAGLMLYQSNGDTGDSGTIRYTTTHQPSQRIFIRFLKSYLGLKPTDLRFQLVLHQKHSEEATMRSWKRVTGLPYSQFHKTQYLHSSSTQKPLHSGVGSTIIGNTVLKRKLLTWLKLAQKDLAKP